MPQESNRHESAFWLAFAAVLVVRVSDYTYGFHDAANTVATMMASRVMAPAQAVVFVGVFGFLGPFFGVRLRRTPSAWSTSS